MDADVAVLRAVHHANASGAAEAFAEGVDVLDHGLAVLRGKRASERASNDDGRRAVASEPDGG